MISAQGTLATLVAMSYAWQAIDVALSIEATRAIDVLRGGHTFYSGNIELVSGTLVGLGAAVALLFAAVLSLSGRVGPLDAAFAFAAGLSFPGFLQALDLMLGVYQGGYVAYVIQEAAAFAACIAALALTRRLRIQMATA
jgi:hypothetical protein